MCVRLLLSHDGQSLEVVELNDNHSNHIISRDTFLQLPQQRRLDESELRRAQNLLSANNKSKAVTQQIRQLTGKTVTLKDIANVAHRLRKNTSPDILKQVSFMVVYMRYRNSNSSDPYAGTGSSISCKGRRGVAGFYAPHYSVCLAFWWWCYLLSIAASPPLPPNEGSYQLQLGWPSDDVGFELCSPFASPHLDYYTSYFAMYILFLLSNPSPCLETRINHLFRIHWQLPATFSSLHKLGPTGWKRTQEITHKGVHCRARKFDCQPVWYWPDLNIFYSSQNQITRIH